MTLRKVGRKIKREKSKQGQYQENPAGLGDIYGQGGKTLRYICYPGYQVAGDIISGVTVEGGQGETQYQIWLF